MPLYTINKKIACKPTGKHSAEPPKTTRGFAMTDDRKHLFVVETAHQHTTQWHGELTILPPGTKLHLPSDAYMHEWNRKVLTHTDGTEFILVPEELVIAIELAQ